MAGPCVALGGLLVAGCMTVSPLAGPAQVAVGYEYSRGQASQAFAAPPEAVEEAIRSAMEELRMQALPSVREPGLISLRGTTPDHRRVAIALQPSPGVTTVRTRVGWLGDAPVSRALMDRVAIRLAGPYPPPPAPAQTAAEPEAPAHFSRDAVPDSVMLRNHLDGGFRDAPLPD